MAFILFLAVVFNGEKEFFEMVDQRYNEGCRWHWVGRTEVENEIALPAKESDGTLVYYWHICEK